MRLYTFTNVYISSIQKGIQSAHLAVDLVRKYATGSLSAPVKKWADNHKTMIVLNGGNSAMLADLLQAFEIYDTQARAQHSKNLPLLPFASFSEDEQSLNSALTCVGCVLPEELYSIRPVTLNGEKHVFGLPGRKPDSGPLILPADFLPSKRHKAQDNLAYLLSVAKSCQLAI